MNLSDEMLRLQQHGKPMGTQGLASLEEVSLSPKLSFWPGVAESQGERSLGEGHSARAEGAFASFQRLFETF